MSVTVTDWWYFLCAVAGCNMVAWTTVAARIRYLRPAMSMESYRACRMQLILSAVYVFGCAFRSVFPVYDLGRVSLSDSWLSSVVVGRSVATLAELSFVAQWALMLRSIAVTSSTGAAERLARMVVPLIALAELCCWYAVLTTANAGQVIEALIWGLSAALVVIGIFLVRRRTPSAERRTLTAWGAAGVAYVAFMFLYDVPMYWSRWRIDAARGRPHLAFAQGLHDVAHLRVMSYSWQDWNGEMVWMSLYFTFGVWISISLVYFALRAVTAAAPYALTTAVRPAREVAPALTTGAIGREQ